MTIKMAARSSSTSLKPARILRITYKELSALAEKLEKESEKSPTKNADKSKLNERVDLVSNENEKRSSKHDVKNADVSSKQKSRKSNSEKMTTKKDKERANPKEEKVKEHKEKKKKGRKSSSGSKTKRKQTADGGECDESSDREADYIEEKDISGDLIRKKSENKVTKNAEDKERKTQNGDRIKLSAHASAKNGKKNHSEPNGGEDSASESAEKPRGILKLPQGLGPQIEHKITEQKSENASKNVSFEKSNRDDCRTAEKRCTEIHDPEYSRNLSTGQHGRALESTKLLYDPKNPARKPALEKIAERKKAEGIASRLQMLNLDKNDDEPVGKALTLFDLSEDNATEKLVGHQTNDIQSVVDVKAEKKIKHLNRQKAQQLMKQAAKPETELRNLLCRDFLKNNTYSSVKAKSKEIQDSYKAVITLDISLAVQNDIDHSLWKNAFYQIIESLRKCIKSFEDLSGNELSCFEETEEVYTKLLEFLDCGLLFYNDLLEVLQTTHKFDVDVVVVHPYRVRQLGRTAKFALLSCHNVLVFLGDLERYREQLLPTAAKKWGTIRSYYYKASKLVPKNGKPYNQLAVVAVLANRKMDAVYYYMRSLAVSNPILTAREKLITIFYEIQKKADQVARREEELKKQEARIKEMEQSRQAGRGRGRGRGKNVGIVQQDPSHYRHEVWVFVRGSKYRRLVLTDAGRIQELNRDDSVTEEEDDEENAEEQSAATDVSLVNVNKKFVLHFLCAHGLLYSRIGMERLSALQHQLSQEFQTLLSYPSCSAVSCSRLLQMMAINMFSVENTAPKDQSTCYIHPGTPQDQALGLSVNMFTALLMVCSSLAKVLREEGISEGENGNHDNQSTAAVLRQYLPAVKVWMDWMVQHAALWQASNVCSHVSLWEGVALLVNSVIQLGLPDPPQDEGDEVVSLHEDEFLSGFKPLIESNKPLCKVKHIENKASVEDSLRVKAIMDFASFLTLLEYPVLHWESDTGMFVASGISAPIVPNGDHTPPSKAQFEDADEWKEDLEKEPMVEFAEDSGEDGVFEIEDDKNVRELKAKKKSLKRKVEENRQREHRAKAVIEEYSSKPRLVMENYPTYLVPDTNCFVDNQEGIRAIVASRDFIVVIPLVVINELDGLKKDLQMDKYADINHARFVMESARSAVDFLEDEFSKRSTKLKALTSKGSVLETIAFRSEDPSGRKGNNDDVILSCCLHYCEENFVNRLAEADHQMTIRRKVVLLTDDRNLRLKAHTRNVPVLSVTQFCKMAKL